MMHCTFCGSKETKRFNATTSSWHACCEAMHKVFMGDKFPKGKLHADDEGVQPMGIYVKDNRLIMDFGRDIAWMGFEKAGVKVLIEALTEKLRELT